MNEPSWYWQPHAGHYICADDCLFHLNTYIPASSVIVSTVGEHVATGSNGPPMGNGTYTYMGAYDQTLYETMVFRAYRERNECCHTACCLNGVGFRRYKTSEEAVAGHLEMCAEWHAKRKVWEDCARCGSHDVTDSELCWSCESDRDRLREEGCCE